MAKASFNPAIGGVRGKLGNYVFRKQNGKDVIAVAPDDADRAPPSPQQQAGQARFREAAAYANAILADPLHKELYLRLAKERKQTAQSLLIRDFLNPPEVEAIDLRDFHGQAGDAIRVVAHDYLEVVSLEITLTSREGVVLESGAATKEHELWIYRPKAAVPTLQPVIITATAIDRPGHTGSAQVTFVA